MKQDHKPKAVTVPAVIKKALAKEPAAKAIFDKLPPSHRREHIKRVTEAKQEETIQRRVTKMISNLLEKAEAKG